MGKHDPLTGGNQILAKNSAIYDNLLLKDNLSVSHPLMSQLKHLPQDVKTGMKN